MLGYKNII